MADNNEQKLAGAADKAAEALKAAAQAAEQANEQKAEGCGCCGDACRCGDKAENEAAADAAKAEVDELAETAKKLEAANAKAAEHFDLYVRAVAEMENVRRRCAEDVQKAQKFSIEKFAQNLLPVVDSLEKAIEVSQDMEGPMKEGVQATYRQLGHSGKRRKITNDARYHNRTVLSGRFHSAPTGSQSEICEYAGLYYLTVRIFFLGRIWSGGTVSGGDDRSVKSPVWIYGKGIKADHGAVTDHDVL